MVHSWKKIIRVRLVRVNKISQYFHGFDLICRCFGIVLLMSLKFKVSIHKSCCHNCSLPVLRLLSKMLGRDGVSYLGFCILQFLRDLSSKTIKTVKFTTGSGRNISKKNKLLFYCCGYGWCLATNQEALGSSLGGTAVFQKVV